MERRGLERERRTGINLRRELEGAADAFVARFEEAFSGRTRSEVEASFRSLCRLRCGSSAFSGGMAGGIREVFAAWLAIVDSPLTAEVRFPLLELALAFSRSAFAEKYPSRNLTPVPATVFRTFDV